MTRRAVSEEVSWKRFSRPIRVSSHRMKKTADSTAEQNPATRVAGYLAVTPVTTLSITLAKGMRKRQLVRDA
jgi:hypothetical protein